MIKALIGAFAPVADPPVESLVDSLTAWPLTG
jgi:hypothetical protein